jgi:hypothetical protein
VNTSSPTWSLRCRPASPAVKEPSTPATFREGLAEALGAKRLRSVRHLPHEPNAALGAGAIVDFEEVQNKSPQIRIADRMQHLRGMHAEVIAELQAGAGDPLELPDQPRHPLRRKAGQSLGAGAQTAADRHHPEHQAFEPCLDLPGRQGILRDATGDAVAGHEPGGGGTPRRTPAERNPP